MIVITQYTSRVFVFVILALLLNASPVVASFHFARVVEVFSGSNEHPNAQYVVIMAYSDFQSQFNGVEVTVYDSSGSQLVSLGTMTQNLPSNTTNQIPILIATNTARTVFGIVPDHTATGALPTDGLVCFRKAASVPDCVSFGAYTGVTTVGGSEAGSPAASVPSGMAYVRDLGGDSTLQALDDSNDSSVDFFAGVPSPGNFAGARVSNISVDGNVTLDWGVSTVGGYTIHKTDNPATVRLSTPVAGIAGVNWVDPTPNQFPGLSCYVVKP
ncbi:MAG: hypothetical protein OEV00_01840 [Acidobacteriota bacterium]|nr:hypothetical protein [Acidobacteriota bacterium]MDH3784050.1 hypothetical protein [Acidobacteriota bacterium]